MTEFSPQACLALAEQSPRAVAEHDKQGWLDLFAHTSRIEDPVGAAAHTSPAPGADPKARLGRFYETFIAPNQIRFHVDRDVVCAMHVMRDITIEIVMSRDITVHVPVHLLYELVEEEGLLKISRLAAHWELWPMLKQQLGGGWSFAKVGSASAVRMLRQLGPGGMLGFARGASGVGKAGKAQVQKFAAVFNSTDRGVLAGFFVDPGTAIAFPHGADDITVGQCAAMAGELHFSKLLAAGCVVTATVCYRNSQTEHLGVAVFELEKNSRRILRLTFYW